MKFFFSALFFCSLAMSISSCSSNRITGSFLVEGICEMCTDRIEATAKSTDGVKKASYQLNKQLLTCSFDSTKTALSEIQKTIALAGHSTSMFKGDTTAYNNLPGCCKKGGSCDE